MTERKDRADTSTSGVDMIFGGQPFRGSSDYKAQVFDASQSQAVQKFRKIRNDQFFNPYGMVSNNHRVLVYTGEEKDQKAVFTKDSSIVDKDVVGVYAVLAVNDYLVATAGDDSCIKIWNLDENNIECIQTLIGHSNSVHSLCLLQYSKIIASGSSGESASIKIWNITDGTCLKTLKGKLS